MSLDDLKARLPDYAKDLRLNLGGIAGIASLTPQQLWGTALATAIASRNPDVVRAIDATASEHLTEQAKTAARSAAAIMAMNNISYRFTHLSRHPDFLSMPARLRMNVIGNPGIDKLDFELLSLAVSAINGCGTCVASHERQLRKHEFTREAVQSAVRIAATVHAVARVLEAAKIESAAAEAQAA